MRADRCPHCGSKRRLWTPAEILQAVRVYVAEHGHPPTIAEWRKGAPDHPSYSTVCYIFGSWRTMLADAGYEPNPTPVTWTKPQIADAFVDWRVRHGRWPIALDWRNASADHPCTATVIRIFGSWNKGRRAAGYTGSQKAKHRALNLIGVGA